MTTTPQRQIAAALRSLHVQGLISGSEGNASVRSSSKKTFYISASGCHKGMIGPTAILEMNAKGEPCKKNKRTLSTERFFHLAIYQHHAKVCAIVHAHPPYVTALSLAGFDFNEIFLAETPYALGHIAHLPYTLPSSKKLAQAIADLLPIQKPKNSIVLGRHGAITFSTSLTECLSAMEILEKTAKIIFFAKLISAAQPMAKNDVDELTAHLKGMA